MNSGRRIAAAVLTAALSMGAIGLSAGPAEAYKDTTWPVREAVTTPSQVADTTWPTFADTTWPSLKDLTLPSSMDTTWPTGG